LHNPAVRLGLRRRQRRRQPFVCEWPVHHIGESRAEVDAGPILDAAARSIVLWPERA
jgi:hypothetical protein